MIKPVVIRRCGEVENGDGATYDDLALYDTDENGEIIEMDCSPDEIIKLIMRKWYRDVNCFICRHNEGLRIHEFHISALCGQKDAHVHFFFFDREHFETGHFKLIPGCYPDPWTETTFLYRRVRIPEDFEILDTGRFPIDGVDERFLMTDDHIIGCFKGGSGVQKHFSRCVRRYNPQTIEITKAFFHRFDNDDFPDRFILGNGVFRTDVVERARWILENVEDDQVMRFTFQNGIPREESSICEFEIDGDTLVLAGTSNDENIMSPRPHKMGYWYQEPFFTVDLEGFWNGIENGKISR